MAEAHATPTDVVLTEELDRVLVVTINRPEVRNAIDQHVSRALADAMARAEQDRDIWAVVLTGAGDRAFSAGADLKAYSRGEPVHAPEHPELGFGGFVRNDISKPVIAAVNGFAFGGGLEFVLHCDLAVAAESATFALPEVKVGMMAAAGGTIRLREQIPAKVAAELVLTGEPITAARALELGLVNRVVADGTALDEALRLAQTITRNAPLSVQASKRTMLGIGRGDGPRDAAAWEHIIAEDAAMHESDDSREGVLAFVEKREPRWTAS